MRAGSEGERIESASDTYSVTGTYAILFAVDSAAAFVSAVREADTLRVAYIVTDDESQFRVIAAQLPSAIETVRLYAAYLDNAKMISRG